MKSRTSLWCLPLVGVLGVLVGAAESEGTAARKRSQPFVLRAHVIGVDDTGRHAGVRKRRVFVEAYDAQSLEFDVYWRRRPRSERPTHIDLYLPNGDLYRSVDVATLALGRDAPRKSLAATARIPIAGTIVTRYELYGRWRADVCWEDGRERTCQRLLRFFVHQ